MVTPIFEGQYAAALAFAESCDVLVYRGALEMSFRHMPSDELDDAFVASIDSIVGLLGWALPMRWTTDPRPGMTQRAGTIAWPTRGWGCSGLGSKN